MAYDSKRPPKAVILAAGAGARPTPDMNDLPICLESVGGSLIVERLIRNCLSCGISQFVVVIGHRKDEVKAFIDKTFRGIRVSYVVNDRYQDTNSGHSLMLAQAAIGGAEFVKLNAELMFDVKILRHLLDSPGETALCIDTATKVKAKDIKVIVDDRSRVMEIGASIVPKTATGELVGIEKIGARAAPKLFTELGRILETTNLSKATCDLAYQQLVAQDVPVEAIDVSGLRWIKVATTDDFTTASEWFSTPVTTISRSQQKAADVAAAKV